jgi:hypothetical protein
MLYLPKLASNLFFLPVKLNLLRKKNLRHNQNIFQNGYFWKCLEIFGTTLLLGVITSIQCIKNDIDLIGIALWLRLNYYTPKMRGHR